MLGFLLARAGIEVAVLEKHADFFRDFRGDTIHPSTLELMSELGLLDEFLALPHQEVVKLRVEIGDSSLRLADFSRLPGRCKFLAFMPQWDFLNFLAEHGKRYPGFHLHVETNVTDLIVESDRVVGVRAMTPAGPLEIRADLVVGADGRHSVVREKAGLAVIETGAPMDVLWMRVPRKPDDPDAFGRVNHGKMMVLLNRGDYWQCAFIIPKGGYDGVQLKGIEAFRAEIVALVPFLQDRTLALRDWGDVQLLTVAVDRLRNWSRPGLLCIGDAAHAMSPIGGVGINLALQDAVAAANILAPYLSGKPVGSKPLQALQRRRTFPTVATQRVQVAVQNNLIVRVLRGTGKMTPPFALRIVDKLPFLQQLFARFVGLGFRPEHIATKESIATHA